MGNSVSANRLHESHSGTEGAATSAGERARAEAVEHLFREHNQALVSLLTQRLQSVQDAKEVAQEAYVKLLQLDRPGAISLLRSYLFRIATNLAVDRLRRRGFRVRSAAAVEAELFQAFDTRDGERQSLAEEQVTLVRRFLEELPVDRQRAFWLHRVEGCTVTDIAVQLNISERMVRYHVTGALLYCQLRLAGVDPAEAKEHLARTRAK
jgi:RNA polymerase sigma factor (sigma-70 family)